MSSKDSLNLGNQESVIFEYTGKMPISKHSKLVLKDYEARCSARNIPVFTPIKEQFRDAIEDSQAVVRIVFNPNRRAVKPYFDEEEVILALQDQVEGVKKDAKLDDNHFSNEKALTYLSPLIDAIRAKRYTYLEYIYVWGIHMDAQESSKLASLIGSGIYPIKVLCIFDCLLSAHSLGCLANYFNATKKLTEIYLDFNSFGDEGCRLLSQGMKNNRTITLMSLRYCDLTKMSGIFLGEILEYTPVKEIYLDGNCLEAEGAIAVIGPLADFVRYIIEHGDPRSDEEAKKLAKQTEKKRGKKSSKVIARGYPPCGPFITKISLSDNSIDHLGVTKNINSMIFVRLLAIILGRSPDFEELDIWGNDIGELGAHVILESLKQRRDARLSPLGIRMGPKLGNDVLMSIMKLAPGSLKRKQKKSKR